MTCVVTNWLSAELCSFVCTLVSLVMLCESASSEFPGLVTRATCLKSRSRRTRRTTRKTVLVGGRYVGQPRCLKHPTTMSDERVLERRRVLSSCDCCDCFACCTCVAPLVNTWGDTGGLFGGCFYLASSICLVRWTEMLLLLLRRRRRQRWRTKR